MSPEVPDRGQLALLFGPACLVDRSSLHPRWSRLWSFYHQRCAMWLSTVGCVALRVPRLVGARGPLGAARPEAAVITGPFHHLSWIDPAVQAELALNGGLEAPKKWDVGGSNAAAALRLSLRGDAERALGPRARPERSSRGPTSPPNSHAAQRAPSTTERHRAAPTVVQVK